MAFTADASGSEQKGIQKATEHLAAASDTEAAKIPALGQALAAASVPVVLPALQQTALTPPTAAAIATAVANPDGVTFNAPVEISDVGGTYILLGRTASELTRLHELAVTLSAADTVYVYTATAADGTGKAAVADWALAATGHTPYPLRLSAAQCVKTAAVGDYLLLYAATATLTGFAVTSHKAT